MRIAFSYRGKEETRDLPTAGVVIGRAKLGEVTPDLDLSPDMRVSRRHARIWLENEQCWIEDLGSKRGTFVEGKDIRGLGKIALAPGVPVQVGDTTLKVVADQPAGQAQGGGQALRLLPRGVRTTASCLRTVNYSLVHADVPFLSEVTLVNEAETPLGPVDLEVVLPGYATSERVSLPVLPSGATHKVSPLPYLNFDRRRFQILPDRETVAVEVHLNGEPAHLTPPLEVMVLPPNAWHCVGHEVALAGFVLPHSDAVEEIVSRARFELGRLLKGVVSFGDALECPDPHACEATLKALYFCLQERYGITYEYEPRTCSYASDWQLVRFPHDVLQEHEATCIDAALLFAACVENVHRDALLFIVKTGAYLQHALIGCWRDRSPLGDAVIRDENKVRRWAASGDMLVLDSKGFTQTQEFPKGMPFDLCQQEGIRYIEENPLVYALDILAARDRRITEMPFGKRVQWDRPAWLARFRARREAETLQSPSLMARHLLLALLSLQDGLLQRVLAGLGPQVAGAVAQAARASLHPAERPSRNLREGPHWLAVITRAEEAAARRGDHLVTEADLVRALLESESQVEQVLREAGLSRQGCLAILQDLTAQRPLLSE